MTDQAHDNTEIPVEISELQPLVRAARLMSAQLVALRITRPLQTLAVGGTIASFATSPLRDFAPTMMTLASGVVLSRESNRAALSLWMRQRARKSAKRGEWRLASGFETLAICPYERRAGFDVWRTRRMLQATHYASNGTDPLLLGVLTHETGRQIETLKPAQKHRMRRALVKFAARAEQHDSPILRAQGRLALWNATARIDASLALDGEGVTEQFHTACRDVLTGLGSAYEALGADGADIITRALHVAFPECHVLELYADVLEESGDHRIGFLRKFLADSDPRKVAAWCLLGGTSEMAPHPWMYDREHPNAAVALR
ncbi:MAG: hypothetical protein ACOYN3_05810 [Acidimicrobiia bacterium]